MHWPWPSLPSFCGSDTPCLPTLPASENTSPSLQEWHKIGSIIRCPATHLYTGDNLGIDATHQMDFDPLAVINFPAILLVKPAHEATGTKARGIDRKVILDALERQTAQGDELGERLGETRVSEVIGDTVKVRCLIDVLFGLSFP